MKKWMFHLSIISLLLYSTVAFSAINQKTNVSQKNSINQKTNPDLFTDNMLNGRFWQRTQIDRKIMYLTGFNDGINLLHNEFAKEAAAKGIKKFDENFVANVCKPTAAQGYDTSVLALLVDVFYEDKLNIEIPIAYAHVATVRKLTGSTEQEYSNFISELRKKFNHLGDSRPVTKTVAAADER